MITYYYPTEAHMRGAHPFLAFLLSNIATLKDGLFTATEAGTTYTWNA